MPEVAETIFAQSTSTESVLKKVEVDLESRLNRGSPEVGETIFAQSTSTESVLQKAWMENLDL